MDLTIFNSTFSENIVRDDEFSIGEIFSNRIVVEIWGGAIFNAKGRINIHDSNFSSNSANEGGAIFNWQGRLIVSDSIINQNTASQNGGAICNNNGNLTVSDSIMNQNTAKHEGGAINNIHESIQYKELYIRTINRIIAIEYMGNGLVLKTGHLFIVGNYH